MAFKDNESYDDFLVDAYNAYESSYEYASTKWKKVNEELNKAKHENKELKRLVRKLYKIIHYAEADHYTEDTGEVYLMLKTNIKLKPNEDPEEQAMNYLDKLDEEIKKTLK